MYPADVSRLGNTSARTVGFDQEGPRPIGCSPGSPVRLGGENNTGDPPVEAFFLAFFAPKVHLDQTGAALER